MEKLPATKEEEMVHLSPAAYVVHVIGGVRETARVIGRSPTAVSKWRTPKARKGTGGRVPRKNHVTILGFAAANGLDITPDDLKNGRLVKMPRKEPWEC